MTSTLQKEENAIFGDWNGHLFTIDRKKCLLFMNNKTCYSVLIANVLKKDTKDFGNIFKERLIRQLDHDFKINERQEVKLRNELGNIILTKSNNDKKIIGTINHQVENLKYNNFGQDVEHWDDVNVTGSLNGYLVGTKIAIEGKINRDYFRPVELMAELIK